MKKIYTLLAAALILASCGHKAPKLETQTDTLSWALGENLALNLKADGSMQFDNDIVLQAIRHTLDGKEQPISDAELTAAMQYITQQAAVSEMQKSKKTQTEATEAQEKYFADLVANNPNVKRHNSGFYYEALREGKGPKAAFAQRIKFDYRGSLMLTGEVFDQTYGARPPIVTVLGNPMFQGLQAGLQLMQAGSKYRFYFPWQMAFGERGSSVVPPYAPLIYEVELHEIYPD